MTYRRRTALLGLALVAPLAVGLAVAVLWPVPSEAERAADLLRQGMPHEQWRGMVERHLFGLHGGLGSVGEFYSFSDGSRLYVTRHFLDEQEVIASIEVSSAGPVHPLTRLRRTLARALPFVGE